MSKPKAMIRLVFDKFAELRSAYAVFRYFTVNGLRLGFRRLRGERNRRPGMASAFHSQNPSGSSVIRSTREPMHTACIAQESGIPRQESVRVESGSCLTTNCRVDSRSIARLHLLGNSTWRTKGQLRQTARSRVRAVRPGVARRCWRALSSAASAAIT